MTIREFSLKINLLSFKSIMLFFFLFFSSSCVKVEKPNVDVVLDSQMKNVSLVNVSVVNSQLVITGKNLHYVKKVGIKGQGLNENFAIESKDSEKIVLNGLKNISLSLGQVFDLVLSDAGASATFPINISLANGSVTAIHLSNMGASAGQVLKFNGTNWAPASQVDAQVYMGTWDSSTGTLPDIDQSASGDYYIVTVASDNYGVGDWIISDGYKWSKVAYSKTAVTSFNGRKGIVTLVPADYVSLKDSVTHKLTGSTLNDIADIDITVNGGLANGSVLKWNASTSKWEPGSDVGSGAGVGSGTVTNVTVTAPLVVSNGATTPALSIPQASTTANGYLASSDWNTFNGKQALIAAGTTAQYYRGDKTWQSLENAILGNALTGFATNNTAITSGDSVLVGFNKAQGQINALKTADATHLIKNGTDAITGVVNVGTTGLLQLTYVPVGMNDATNKTYVDTKLSLTGGTVTGDVSLNTQLKLKNGGAANYITVKAPTAGTTAYTLSLPVDAGVANQVLTTDGNGATSWTTVSGGGGGAPSGAAGGDLSGIYPNPTITALNANKIADGSVTSAQFQYLSGVTSNIQTQLNAKQATISKTTTQDVSKIRIYGANATNYVELSAATLTGNRSLIFPDTNGASGNVLSTDGSGNLSWIVPPSAPVTSVNGSTGVVSLTTTNINEGTNLYHTDARTIAAPLTGFSATNSAIVATDTVLQGFNKAQGQIAAKENTVTAGTTAQYYRGDKSWQTLDTSVVPENTNLYFTNARVLGVPLTGFVTTDTSAIVATDTALQAIGKAQGQLNNKLSSASFIQWDQSGVQTIHPSRLSLGAGSASKAVVTDASGFIVGGGATATEVGYLSGVTSAIQTQLNSKLSVESDPTVSAFAKAVLPTCGAGEVLKGNGTSLSCVTDATGTGGTWGVNGSDIYYNTGNVGIGTNAPGSSFHIYKNINSANAVIIENTNNGSAAESTVTIKNDIGYGAFELFSSGFGNVLLQNKGLFTVSGAITGGLGFATLGSAPITFNTNSFNGVVNERLRIDSAGNIGIGTTSPGSTLDVKGTLRLSGSTSGYVGFAPAAAAGSTTYTLPAADGSNGYVLQTNGSGVLSWVAASGGGAVSSVHGRTGAVVATAGDYTATQVTNTAAGNIAATTVQAALDELDSEKESTASLASDVRAIVLTGLSTATNAVIAATDSILVAFGKLQAQVSAKLDTSSFVNWAISGIQTIDPSRLNIGTASRAIASNSSGQLVAATATDTELNYLSGVTSAVQTQLNNKVSSQWTTSGSDIYYNGGVVTVGASTAGAEKLSVTGNIKATGQIYSGQYIVASGASVDFNNGNLQILQSVGGSTITVSNMKDGGSYVVLITDATARTYTFSGCTNSKFSPANAATTASTATIYNILKVTISSATYCYISWGSSYQ